MVAMTLAMTSGRLEVVFASLATAFGRLPTVFRRVAMVAACAEMMRC